MHPCALLHSSLWDSALAESWHITPFLSLQSLVRLWQSTLSTASLRDSTCGMVVCIA
ncbi:hypothetical protein [Helicobacter sp.]|uniref:hypothetical protein n=1 Tax=Helicobacter sp. TaxID=218 RepID=UPI0025BCFF7E|nr:hypothetical protein [Helicobacter sp.]MCI5632145.1 hypothetical protein [Helicobacter sp.]